MNAHCLLPQQAAMAIALGPYLAPGGGGIDLEHKAAANGPTLGALATICTIADIQPELLLVSLPASAARTWPSGATYLVWPQSQAKFPLSSQCRLFSTGLGPMLSRLRESIFLCGDRVASLAMQDLRLTAHAVLKVSMHMHFTKSPSRRATPTWRYHHQSCVTWHLPIFGAPPDSTS